MTSYGSIPVKKRHRVHLVGMNVPMQAKCAVLEPLYSRARLRGRPQPSQPPRALRHGAAAPGDAVPGHPEAQMPDCSPAAKGFGSEDLSEEKICHQVSLWGAPALAWMSRPRHQPLLCQDSCVECLRQISVA